MGELCELWGEPGSGKSTFAYQSAGYFQSDYRDGIVHIIDAENSYDELRVNHVFGLEVENPNLIVEHAPTIEETYRKITKAIRQSVLRNVPYLGIIDSWSVLSTNSDVISANASIEKDGELNMYSGGQMLKARVGKHYLNHLMSEMYRRPITVFIINQVITSPSRWGSTLTSGGGYGLKHDIQCSLYFERGPHKEVGNAVSGVVSRVTIAKSKFLPEIKSIPCYIDSTSGGRFNPREEIMNLALSLGMITQQGGWYRVDGVDKSHRWSDLVDNNEVVSIIKSQLIKKYRSEYMLVDLHYKENESRLNANPN